MLILTKQASAIASTPTASAVTGMQLAAAGSCIAKTGALSAFLPGQDLGKAVDTAYLQVTSV